MKKFLWKIRFHSLLIAVTLFSLIGCSSRKYMECQFPESGIPDEEKATVILRVSAISPRNEVVSVYSHWCNLRTNEYFKTNTQSFWEKGLFGIVRGDQKQLAPLTSIQPGPYTFTDFYFSDGEYSYHNRRALSNMVNFSVKKGDVVYLGDLIFNFKDNLIPVEAMTIVDSYEEVKEELTKTNPALGQRLQKRLMEASPPAALMNQLFNQMKANLKASPQTSS